MIAFLADNRAALLAAAEASLTKALSLAPEHAVAHFWLGGLQIQTNRATQGIAECGRALALDRNLARAHPMIGVGKLFIGRGEETEAHIKEALRLSPRFSAGSHATRLGVETLAKRSQQLARFSRDSITCISLPGRR